jgi:hypothetical protein
LELLPGPPDPTFLVGDLQRHRRAGEIPLRLYSNSSVLAQGREVAALVRHGPRVLMVRTLSLVAPRRATASRAKSCALRALAGVPRAMHALHAAPGQRCGPTLRAFGPHRVRRSGFMMGPGQAKQGQPTLVHAQVSTRWPVSI